MKQITMIEGIAELVWGLTLKNNFSFCQHRELQADVVVNCTGQESNPFKTDSKFFKNLLTRGLTKANVNGLGIQTTLEGRVVGSGKPIPLYALD